MSDTIATLKYALEQAEEALKRAEQARDGWEPDSDNPDHTAPYDSTLGELYDDTLPTWLRHVQVSDLMREHNWSEYIDGFNSWEDSLRRERERRATWSDFDELCEAVEDAEAERDDAAQALEDAEEDLETDIEDT